MTITRNQAITAAVIALLAIVYFVAVPYFQLRGYRPAEAKHNLVADQLAIVYDSFKNGHDNRQAVTDAQSALDANKSAMTKFQPLPALSWNKPYQAGADTDKNEGSYVAKSQTFLDDYTALLDLKSQPDSPGLLNQAKVIATRLKLDSKIQLDQVELKLLNTKISQGYAQFK
jgi:hypothetical protein